MTTEFQSIKVQSNEAYYSNSEYHIPAKCPHCNLFIFAETHNPKQANYNSGYNLDFLTHKCPSCSKLYLTMHLHSLENNEKTFISIYPELINVEIPAMVEEKFPRFAEIYKQASTAENLNHIELAATGYRMALEILAKAFAIAEHPNEEETIKNSSLNNCLQNYYKDLMSSVAGHVVKTLGNDYAHYVRKHMDVEFTELKYYLQIFILYIEMQLKLKNPPVTVPDLKAKN